MSQSELSFVLILIRRPGPPMGDKVSQWKTRSPNGRPGLPMGDQVSQQETGDQVSQKETSSPTKRRPGLLLK